MYPLQASIISGILIIIILAIRMLTKKVLPKTTYRILWQIALLKLLIPVSVSSFFSIYNIIVFSDAKALFDMITVKSTSAGDIITLVTLKLVEAELQSGINLLPILWLVGGLAVAIFFTRAMVKYRSINNMALPIKDNAYIENWLNAHRLKRHVRVFSSEKLTTPIAAGLFRPRIILPRFIDLGDTKQLDYILTHELIHIKRFDAVWKTLLVIALCIHWFNPAVWLLYRFLCRDMELSCDEQVINSIGGNSKADYALSLLHVAQLQNGHEPIAVGYATNTAEERIVSVMKYRRTSAAAVLAAVLIIFCVTGIFATSASDNMPEYGFIHITARNSPVKIMSGQMVYFFPDTFQMFRQVRTVPNAPSVKSEAEPEPDASAAVRSISVPG